MCIDDTIGSKFGRNFEEVSKLFDHAANNGSNYLNGHCFVSLMLCLPVWNRARISYLAVPLGYRMWQKKESALELAASMIRYGVRPCNTDQVRGFKFIHDGEQILFYIPAVAEDNDIFLFSEFRHHSYCRCHEISMLEDGDLLIKL